MGISIANSTNKKELRDRQRAWIESFVDLDRSSLYEVEADDFYKASVLGFASVSQNSSSFKFWQVLRFVKSKVCFS